MIQASIRGVAVSKRMKLAAVAVRHYFDDPPSVDELRAVVTLLGVRPVEVARHGEPLLQCEL